MSSKKSCLFGKKILNQEILPSHNPKTVWEFYPIMSPSWTTIGPSSIGLNRKNFKSMECRNFSFHFINIFLCSTLLLIGLKHMKYLCNRDAHRVVRNHKETEGWVLSMTMIFWKKLKKKTWTWKQILYHSIPCLILWSQKQLEGDSTLHFSAFY